MYLSDITNELFREKTRVILTILALAWGTFTIAAMLSIGEGLRLTFANAVSKTGDNIMLVRGGKTTQNYRGTHPNQEIFLRNKDFYAIAKLPNVKAISPIYNVPATLRYGKESTNTQVQAVDANYSVINQIGVMPKGRYINANDVKKRREVIVLGASSYEDLFPHKENPVGKTILVGTQPFQVIGIAQKKAELVVVETPNDYLNWIPYSTLKLLANPSSIDSLAITYKDAKDLPRLKQQILTIIALNNLASPNDDGLLHFDDIASQQSTIEAFFVGMQIFLGVLGGLTPSVQ